jgi:ribosomal protein S18 acetylase RimI-like enzyme
MRIRRPERPDRQSIEELIRSDDTFTEAEVAVALELVDSACDHPGRDYNLLVCEEVREDGAQILGYVCFGPTPMTIGTWDLYWIATHRTARGRGVATRLVDAMQAELQVAGARIVRLETSQLESYGAARSFYARLGFVEVGRIPDFYRQGDDLVTLAKRLDVPAEVALPLPRRATM